MNNEGLKVRVFTEILPTTPTDEDMSSAEAGLYRRARAMGLRGSFNISLAKHTSTIPSEWDIPRFVMILTVLGRFDDE